jgi:CO dehydrogenase maturation factor
MTITIAISGKGGSGKTTIAAMILRYLVEQEKDGAVLAVDADPNSCLGLALLSLDVQSRIFAKMQFLKRQTA